jgi:DNA-binding transcriptional ArsR family regulator
VRLQIVRQRRASQSAEACGTFDLPVGKSTASHHFKVLREAGLIRQHV